MAHLTTVDMSLALLLGTELAVDVEAGHETFGLSAPGASSRRSRRWASARAVAVADPVVGPAA